MEVIRSLRPLESGCQGQTSGVFDVLYSIVILIGVVGWRSGVLLLYDMLRVTSYKKQRFSLKIDQSMENDFSLPLSTLPNFLAIKINTTLFQHVLFAFQRFN